MTVWRCSGTGADRPFAFSQAGLLVDPDHVAGRVANVPDALAGRGVGVHHLAAGGMDGRERCLEVGDHDVDHDPGLSRRRPAGDPRAAHLLDGVVEGDRAVAAGAQLPAERVAVEARRALDVGGGNLEVADLAGCECGGSVRHAH